ncbi:MAG: 4-hydroxy-tetrahydrodipicolinate reductase [Steroidobacteraceae bacterium]|nr:4-hydroxy-tetrahydrodipicolinate reductase [Steroidobacteraceae bacterium]
MQRLTVFGVTGRMGQSVLRALVDTPGFALAGAVASAGSVRVGRDAAFEGPESGVAVTADVDIALRTATVAIDFSLPLAVGAHAAACAQARVPLVVGATGLEAEALAALREAARKIPVLIAPNMSIGVALLERLVRIASRSLGEDFDAEILEAHHRMKRDAPSGTALHLGEAIASARGRPLDELAVLDRQTETGPRRGGTIGFSVLRGGDIVGEHTVIFAGEGERLELMHRAGDRMIFARGALRAAAWLVGRAPGSYGMQDVLDG